MKVLLGNLDYRGDGKTSLGHTSDEGDQFQRGLEHAGWSVAGYGFDNRQDVRDILHVYKPEAVIVHDKRDFDPTNGGCFNKLVGFNHLAALKERRDIFRACVVKDAGTATYYHRMFCDEIGADAAVVYYEPRTVQRLNPWMGMLNVKPIRVHHSIDVDLCKAINLRKPRKRAIITGATSRVYPVRTRVMKRAIAERQQLIHVFGHPGYHNRGAHTPIYLHVISDYRVHVATASMYGFALRKIIESVAVGCTPVTNLPKTDVLPEIDDALVRVSPDANVGEVYAAVERADKAWNIDERIAWAERAWAYYDWRQAGVRLDAAVTEAMLAKRERRLSSGLNVNGVIDVTG